MDRNRHLGGAGWLPMRFLALLLFAALTLAGCSSKESGGGGESPGSESAPSSTSAPSSGPAGPMPLPTLEARPSLELIGCTNHGGVFPVDMAAARAALPAGFEPVPSPSDPAGGATLYVLFLQCEDSKVDGDATGPTNVAYAELAVVPPEGVRLDGIDDYTVPLAMGASADAVGERLASFALGTAGPSTVSDTVNTGQGGTYKLTFAGVTLEIDALVGQQGGALGDGDFALIGVQGGAAKTAVRGHAAGGQASDAVAVLQSEGLPLLEQARPAVRGFSVAGFTLSFELWATFGAPAPG